MADDITKKTKSLLSNNSDAGVKFKQLDNFYQALFDLSFSQEFRPALNEYWTVSINKASNQYDFIGPVNPTSQTLFAEIRDEIGSNTINDILMSSDQIRDAVEQIMSSGHLYKQDKLTTACLYAQSITVPGETTATVNVGNLPGTGSIIFPTLLGNREANNNTIRIAFIESNLSLVDLFIRPWVRICSKKGLVAINSSNRYKADIVASFIMPGSIYRQRGEPQIRKRFLFKDCVPITVNQQDYDYRGGQLVLRTVDFLYTQYILEG